MTALPKAALRPLPVAAASTACAALVAALVVGPGGTIAPTLGLGLIACALLAAEIVRRSIELLRSGGGAYVALASTLLVLAALGWSIVVALHLEFVAVAVIFLLVGGGLVAWASAAAKRYREQGATPWEAITGGPSSRRVAQSMVRAAAPLLLGLLLLFLGLRFFLEVVTNYLGLGLLGGSLSGFGASPVFDLVFLLIKLAALGFVFWVVAMVARAAWRPFVSGKASPGSSSAAPRRSEQSMAAHLHDSVLQTLALIQRQADDPQRVAQLARQQERSLRSWLAGRDEQAASTLAGAVQAVAREVEDETPGAVIDVVTVGDAPLDRQSDAMVRAAREAMRNAVRHAGGPVRVFVEVESGTREVFVRDTGSGFDPGTVPAERRGVRDAIVGRMEHVGGTAQIESGPGGTEVALRAVVRAAGGDDPFAGRP